MQPSRRKCLWASLGLACSLLLSPPVRAEKLRINSTPSGATVEIDGAVAGTTPLQLDFPGGYFHKPHTVFGARLDHAMSVKVFRDGFQTKRMTLTEGPFQWVAINGRHRGVYWLLKSDHFEFTLEPTREDNSSAVGVGAGAGPLHPRTSALTSPKEAEQSGDTGKVTISSEPSGADIYVDGRFAGQTPSMIALSVGEHQIFVRADGKKDWQRKLNVTKDSELTLHPQLEPQP